MPIVKFVNENKEIDVPAGANLREEALKAGIQLNCAIHGLGEGIDNFIFGVSKRMNCGGFGMCGTCRVLITEGRENTNPLTKREQVKFKTPLPTLPIPEPGAIVATAILPCLSFIGNEDKMRLACCTKVEGDIEVQSKPPMNLFGDNFFS